MIELNKKQKRYYLYTNSLKENYISKDFISKKGLYIVILMCMFITRYKHSFLYL